MEEFNNTYKNHLYIQAVEPHEFMQLYFSAVRLKDIAKKGGGVRPLGMPTIADQLKGMDIFYASGCALQQLVAKLNPVLQG
ncbi:hypothetical protein [uncultured Sunxiuqinia sp.]|uniref:hypothetical protein n=1 Tax=uncultured Sunxiuqinia sp. TaxID=1573825 RepID=UPI002AA8B290|nr:hypothetical protein [uncultured Sunxiuqinia sp.]